jgi:hypothetical protein
MPDGARCNSPALGDSHYCYHHDRLHRVFGRQKSGKKNPLVLHPLEDSNSVLMALSDVICALAAGSIDPRNASRLIYGLQVAGRIAPRWPRSLANDPVASVQFTKTGDELAPAITYCASGDRCDSCPRLDDGCDLEKSIAWRAAHNTRRGVKAEKVQGKTRGRGREEDDEENEDDAAGENAA